MSNTKKLEPFEGHLQAQDTWCWAAAIATVEEYARRRIGETKSFPQCHWVRQQHPGPACRNGNEMSADPMAFDKIQCETNHCSVRDQVETGWVVWGLADKKFDLFHDIRTAPIGFTAIRDEIDSGKPLIIRVENPDITHHLVVVFGYDLDKRAIFVWNPARGEQLIRINEFSQRLGRWTHTIFTKMPKPPALPTGAPISGAARRGF